MSSQRQMRKDLQVSQKNPSNVTIISKDGGRKVLTWKEYQAYLNPPKEEEEVIADGVT